MKVRHLKCAGATFSDQAIELDGLSSNPDDYYAATVPDGCTIDADGCYWIAANAGWQLIRYTPQGRIERQIPLPVQRPTMLAFGGPALDTIYVTSQAPRPGDAPLERQPHAGGLFAVSPGIKGLPEPRFRG